MMSDHTMEGANKTSEFADFITDPEIFSKLSASLVAARPFNPQTSDLGFGFTRLDYAAYASLVYSTVATPITSWFELSRQCGVAIDEVMRSVDKLNRWHKRIEEVRGSGDLNLQDMTKLQSLQTLTSRQWLSILSALPLSDVRKLYDLAHQNNYVKETGV